MGQTWILIIISILFVMGSTIIFSSLGYTILMLCICKKSFFFTIFLIIEVHRWNEMNLDSRYNLHSFCYGQYNHVLLIGIHDIDALDLQKKLFFPPFSLQSQFIREMRQTWIPKIISTSFVVGTTIMFFTLGYTILMLWICKKSFSFHDFLYN